jgi:hypothetical protein
MKLGRAAMFSRSTAFPTLDTPLTDLLWHVVKTYFGNTPGPDRPAGPTLGRLGPGLVPRSPFVSYCPWTHLVLDVIKIYMDFGPYGAFPSSDVPVMVDQQNSWNLLVTSTYLLYLQCNIGLLVVNICILLPPIKPSWIAWAELSVLSGQLPLVLMETREGWIPIFQWRQRITRLGKRVDIHGQTTTVQGRCAWATDTPTPVVDVILWSTTTQPRGLLSCKQSKN